MINITTVVIIIVMITMIVIFKMMMMNSIVIVIITVIIVMKNMSAISCTKLLLSHHDIYSILKKAMRKDLDKNKPAILSFPRYLARVIYKIRLNSWNTKFSKRVTQPICTNPISVYHILLECPITTALLKKDGYDFTSCNSVTVIDIVYTTNVIIPIAKLIVRSPVVIITLEMLLRRR